MRTLVSFLLTATVAVLAATSSVAAAPWPDHIELPPGWQPEGIEIGPANTFYVGSIPTGAVFKGDLKTGEGTVLVPPQPGVRAAIGIELDGRGRLFVAGGPFGDAYVYDAATGADIATFDFASGTTFVNDVVVTDDAAWFTDSRNFVLYRVPIAPDGSLGVPEQLPLAGDILLSPGNLNGIEASSNGDALIAVQSNTGTLFRIDPETGVTDAVELANGESVPNGDGILLVGHTLYVVQNRSNEVAEVRIDSSFESGVVLSRTGHADFDVPTTIARKGNTLYLVNARFGTTDPQPAPYWVTAIPRP
jgi:sugar lactone lactonase YvrE